MWEVIFSLKKRFLYDKIECLTSSWFFYNQKLTINRTIESPQIAQEAALIYCELDSINYAARRVQPAKELNLSQQRLFSTMRGKIFSIDCYFYNWRCVASPTQRSLFSRLLILHRDTFYLFIRFAPHLDVSSNVQPPGGWPRGDPRFGTLNWQWRTWK